MNSAQAQSERYGITAVSTEELLACPDIDLVVNLTPVPTHETIIRKALERGKHVYSEKTLTESLKQSAQLLALAEKRGRLLCCAPDTMLSAGVQTARRALQEGRAPMLDARFAYHTQEVIQAVYDSSAERRHICVRSDLPRHCQAALKP